jgi:hypothetical protein
MSALDELELLREELLELELLEDLLEDELLEDDWLEDDELLKDDELLELATGTAHISVSPLWAVITSPFSANM